jgi:c-di-GMP-binding flagellar brake protein YcgR
MVVRERRRYFRCPIAVPAFVRAQQPKEFLCQTVNISEGGVAISTRTMPDSTLPAAVRFSLPDRPGQLFAETKVRWRGQGLVGLEFQSMDSPQKSELQEWLARRLDETLPENVAILFRSVGQPPP